MHDAGPVADITSWIVWEDGILWQGTYFGMSRYDDARWRTGGEKIALVSISLISLAPWPRRLGGTDRGISVTDGDNWVTIIGTNEKG